MGLGLEGLSGTLGSELAGIWAWAWRDSQGHWSLSWPVYGLGPGGTLKDTGV